MMKAYLINSNVELEVRDFYCKSNDHGAKCLMCSCYAPAFGTVEEIPAGRIEIR